jgi:outer membrane autotransporter protein
VGVGLSALFSNRWQGYLSYERLIGVSYLTSNAITLGVRAQF